MFETRKKRRRERLERFVHSREKERRCLKQGKREGFVRSREKERRCLNKEGERVNANV